MSEADPGSGEAQTAVGPVFSFSFRSARAEASFENSEDRKVLVEIGPVQPGAVAD